jgi:hypothetical protein
MVLGLFGGKGADKPLEPTMSKDAFLSEVDKMQTTFGIVSTDAAGKNEPYGKIEATGRFLFEQVLKVGVSANAITSKKEIHAAAMLGVVVVHCLGRNGGMSKTQLQFLLGKVPAYAFALAMDAEHKAVIGEAVPKAILGYAHKIRQTRFRHSVEAVEKNVTQFMLEKDPVYYANLAGDMARFI